MKTNSSFNRLDYKDEKITDLWETIDVKAVGVRNLGQTELWQESLFVQHVVAL